MHHTPASASAPTPCFGSVVVLRGELDLLTAPDTDRRLTEAAGRHPGCDLLVDLREVVFADCAGLKPLARAARRAREEGGTETAMVTSPRLLRVLELTRISEVLVVLPVLEAPAGRPAGGSSSQPGPGTAPATREAVAGELLGNGQQPRRAPRRSR